jgi:integrase
MPKYRRGSGSIYKKRSVYYIAYYANGKQVCESTGTKDRTEARRILQARLGQLAEGRYVGPAAERVTVNELIQDLFTDYEVNVRKSLRMVQGKVKNHVLPYFSGHKAHDVTTADVQSYIQQRLHEGASNAEINRETAALKRAYNLGLRAGKIAKKPYIPKLEEDNARQGFLESWQFDALLARLPAFLRPPVTFAYYTGWRIHSEILPLTWDRIDLEAGTVRLYRGTTKNKDGRVIVRPRSYAMSSSNNGRTTLTAIPAVPLSFIERDSRLSISVADG